MARQITCECGQIVHGDIEDEVVSLTLERLRSDHPQLAELITRDEIVALIASLRAIRVSATWASAPRLLAVVDARA